MSLTLVTGYPISKDMSYSEAGYEDYYDYGDETGEEYTEEASYEEYYEEEWDSSLNNGKEDRTTDTVEGDLSEETTVAPEKMEEETEDSYSEEREKNNDGREEQLISAVPSTTVGSYYVSLNLLPFPRQMIIR